MKDFKEFLEDQEQGKKKEVRTHFKAKMFDDVQESPMEESLLSKVKYYGAKYGSPLGLWLLTGPFNTAAILMQITHKPMGQSLLKKIQFNKENPLVKLGIYGDNKIYQPAKISTYHDCFTQLGKEGIRGFYKGNLTGLLLTVSNTKLRSWLYDEGLKRINLKEEWKKNLMTIVTCTIADFVTLPLMMCQSRLVLQSSLPNFRTYGNFISVLRDTPVSCWVGGASILWIKNLLFSYSWLTLIEQSPVYSFILSSVLSHLCIYPFNTVIRQLQSQAPNVPMMHQTKQSIIQCGKRIWEAQGIRGFYRGFLCYGFVHLFMGFIIVDMNIRSGYFSQVNQ